MLDFILILIALACLILAALSVPLVIGRRSLNLPMLAAACIVAAVFVT